MSPSHILPTVHCDSDGTKSITKNALDTVRTAVAVPESELKRWRRIFDANAKDIKGEKQVYSLVIIFFANVFFFFRFLDSESFVNAIAPKNDPTKIAREQFAVLFRIADTSRRGLVSWEDFTVFETLLKRPDADYWMAFQYFDVSVYYPTSLSSPSLMFLQRPFRKYRLQRI